MLWSIDGFPTGDYQWASGADELHDDDNEEEQGCYSCSHDSRCICLLPLRLLLVVNLMIIVILAINIGLVQV